MDEEELIQPELEDEEEEEDDTPDEGENGYGKKPMKKTLQVGGRAIEVDPTARRYGSFNRAAIDEATRTIDIPVSSEYPVERWWGKEVLEHRSESVDLARLNNGGVLLYSHDHDDYIGVIERAYINNRRLYCRARFDTHDQAEKIWNSVRNGILRNVSIGYMIDQMREDKAQDGECTYYATRWTPFEVSIVTVPADPSVGVGRMLDDDSPPPEPVQHATPVEVLNTEKRTMTDTIEKPQPTIEDIRKAEIDRIDSIRALCDKYKMPALAKQCIDDGSSIEAVRAIVLERLGVERPNQEPIAQPVNPLGLTDKEQRQYSLLNVILAQADPTYRDRVGFEREISDEIAKKLNRSTSGFYIPVRDLKVPMLPVAGERATYAVGASATGGATVETMLDAANLIDFLRNRAMVMRMGGRMLSGLTGNLDIPRVTGVASTFWVGEGGAVSQSESTFDNVQFRPKTVGVKSRMTRLMLLQSSIDIEAFVRQDISTSIALEIDRTCINGSGTANQPRGILNTTGVPVISLGTNGGSPTWANIVTMETRVSVDNADIGSLGYLTNPSIRGLFKTTLKNTSASNSDWIWENGSDPLIGQLNGYPAGVTNQMPRNLTKGTGTNLSSIIFGNWSDIFVGEWGVLELLANPYGAGYDSGDIEVRALQTIDIQLRRDNSFVRIVDAITPALP